MLKTNLLAAICYPHSHLSESQLMHKVTQLSTDEDRMALITAYVGDRSNRRHKPGRAFERVDYRFDVLSDYGAFRDLQRHRLLDDRVAETVTTCTVMSVPNSSMMLALDRLSTPRWSARPGFMTLCTTSFRSRPPMRWQWHIDCDTSMQFNAREAIHMLELRSSSQGHPSYRRVALEMHKRDRREGRSSAIANAMSHMTTEAPELERLEAERRAEVASNPD
jgi:hypothetical protein